jgi:NAD(P)H dehydrogenase (quinone)
LEQVTGITGASGQLGRRILELVIEKAGVQGIVAITRSPGKLADLAAKGVEVRKGDFADGEPLKAALAGIHQLLIISVDDIREGMRPQLHGTAISAAKRAGVKHLVYTSAVKPHHSPIPFLRDHARTEDLIVESGLDYTLLRNNFYHEAVLPLATQALASSAITTAAGAGAAAYLSREDCARVAAAVLTTSGHEGGVYEITGAHAWTREEIAAELSKIVGRKIAYASISEEALLQGMVSNGVSSNLAEFLVGMDRGLRLGALDVVSRAVEQLTGRPPETLPAFLARNKAALLSSAH